MTGYHGLLIVEKRYISPIFQCCPAIARPETSGAAEILFTAERAINKKIAADSREQLLKNE
ncbi:MAG: hypothetical protein CFE23_05695 [Flavobacterium sp. BFFFF1]|nr:MAG: hypothetical protein CFE23_05695 [Flavobacterium sp. BFFFF1]